MANVVLIGTLDTKRDEYGWLRDDLHGAGASTTLIDVGTLSDGAGIADVRSSEVAAPLPGTTWTGCAPTMTEAPRWPP